LRKFLAKEMEVKIAYAEVGLLGRIVTEWARKAEIGALSRRHFVQGPAVRTTSVAVTVCKSFESFAVYEIECPEAVDLISETVPNMTLTPLSTAKSAIDVVNWCGCT
jgi:hypothetical protein